jgi:predicted DNA-binding transcriptional regulator AlpA
MNTDLWSPEELLLPASAAAGMLGVSTDTLARMAARGEGPPRIRVSRQWRYSVAGLRQWKADRLETNAAA